MEKLKKRAERFGSSVSPAITMVSHSTVSKIIRTCGAF